jgi:hypothetical protein
VELAIIDEPIRFRLHGLAGAVGERSYGEAGCALMDEMWRIVKAAKAANAGTNHWVYFAGDRMFVGVELRGAPPAEVLASFEPCEFQLARYARHVHVGPYRDLPQKWQALKAELAARGEQVIMPSLEIYGHACSDEDESKLETTILLGLQPKYADE